jgi:aerobic carbon-monoxide dehydrogenase medium subunit
LKPGKFRYHAPRTLDEAIALLSEHDNAKLLAGGQSLMAMLNLRVMRCPRISSIMNGVPGLDGIANGEEAMEIGAMTRQRAA